MRPTVGHQFPPFARSTINPRFSASRSGPRLTDTSHRIAHSMYRAETDWTVAYVRKRPGRLCWSETCRHFRGVGGGNGGGVGSINCHCDENSWGGGEGGDDGHGNSGRERRRPHPGGPDYARRACLAFVTGHCFLCGVDLYLPGTFRQLLATCHPRAVLLLVVRTFAALMLTLSCVGKAIRTQRALPEHASVNDVFQVLYVFVAYAVFGEAARTFWVNQESFKRLLTADANVRHVDVRRFAVWAVCWLFWTHIDVSSAIRGKDSRTIPGAKSPASVDGGGGSATLRMLDRAGHWCGLYVWQLQYNVFLNFLLGPSIVCGRLVELMSAISTNSATSIRPRRVLQAKADIRAVTAGFNRAFDTMLIVMYSKIFSLVYRALVIVLNFGSTSVSTRLMLVTPCLQISIVYDMASVGTTIVHCCRSTVYRLLLRQDSPAVSHDDLWMLSNLIAFDECQDALTISGSFTNQKETLVAYFGTIIKLSSILLQFDYRIMAKFDQDKGYADSVVTAGVANDALTDAAVTSTNW